MKQSPKVKAELVQCKTCSVEVVESSPDHDETSVNPCGDLDHQYKTCKMMMGLLVREQNA